MVDQPSIQPRIWWRIEESDVRNKFEASYIIRIYARRLGKLAVALLEERTTDGLKGFVKRHRYSGQPMDGLVDAIDPPHLLKGSRARDERIGPSIAAKDKH